MLFFHVLMWIVPKLKIEHQLLWNAAKWSRQLLDEQVIVDRILHYDQYVCIISYASRNRTEYSSGKARVSAMRIMRYSCRKYPVSFAQPENGRG